MNEEKEIVVLMNAKSPSLASLIIQALKFEGIPAFVEGCLLQDEFAISQRLMGANCVDIQVPRSCLKEAREILERLREAGKLLNDPEEDE